MVKNLAVSAGYKLLRVLGNEKRLEILFALQQGEISVGGLEKIIKLSQSALSQHLAVLRRANLVKTRREAQTIYYSIKGEKALQILAVLKEMYA